MLARMVSISWPRDLPASASQSAGIIGVSQCAWPMHRFFNKCFSYFSLISFIVLAPYSLLLIQHSDSPSKLKVSCFLLRTFLKQLNMTKQRLSCMVTLCYVNGRYLLRMQYILYLQKWWRITYFINSKTVRVGRDGVKLLFTNSSKRTDCVSESHWNRIVPWPLPMTCEGIGSFSQQTALNPLQEGERAGEQLQDECF